MSEVTIFALALLAVVLFFLFRSIVIVTQGHVYTVESLGRFTKVLKPGFHILVPFIESVGYKVNMKERVLDIPSQEIITKDNAMVGSDGVVFFQVLDAAQASYEITDLTVAIINLTMTNLRTVMGSMDLDELLSKRDEINARLMAVVDEATQPWGVKVTRIEIKDIAPPADLVDAMGQQMKAERLKRANILSAEGHREAEVLRAEGEKRAAVLEAEGRKEAAILDAEARERAAEAEAKATEMVSAAIAQGNSQAINYFVAQKYVEAMSDFAKSNNAKTIFMPMEVASLVGSIGGIKELVKTLDAAQTSGSSRNLPDAG